MVDFFLAKKVNCLIDMIKYLTNTNKCFKIYAVIKGCEIMEENGLVTQNELAIEDIKNLIKSIQY